jgi:hypothetical protein
MIEQKEDMNEMILISFQDKIKETLASTTEETSIIMY